MTDKRYPTRMHEVLGVEPNEEFYINGEFGIFFLTKEGYLTSDNAGRNSNWIVHAINRGITRRPRLTEEQAHVLEVLYEVFDFKWLAKQKYGRVMAYANKPHKEEEWYGFWFHGEGDNEEDYGWMVKSSSPVCGLVSWSDPEPLNIVQTLRDAGRLEDK